MLSNLEQHEVRGLYEAKYGSFSFAGLVKLLSVI
jgi:hypothetical protein